MEKILRFSAFSTLILLGIFYTITAEILPLSSNTGNERPIIDHGGLDPNLKIKDPDLSSKELEVIKNFTNSLLPGPAIFTETKDALDKPSLINDGTVLQPTDQDKAVDENDEIRSPTQEKDEDTVRPISGLTDEVQPLDGAVEQSKTIDPSKIASELTDVEEKTETMKPLADNVERKPDILNTDSSIETVDGGAKVEETDDNVADTDTDYGHAPLKDEGSRIMTGNEDWSKYEPKENVDDEVIDTPEDTDAGNERTTGTTNTAYTVTTTAATTDWSVSNKVEDNNENIDLTDDDGDDDKDNDKDVWATGTPAWTANTENDWDDGDDDDENNNEDIWATTTPYTSTTNDYWDDDDAYDDSKEYDDNTDVWTGDDKDNSEDDDDNMWDDDDDSDGTWNDDNGDDDIWANDWDDDEDYDNDSSEENDEDDGKWRDEWWKADEGKGWKTDSWSTTTEWTTTYDYDDETATDKTKDIEAGKKLLESPHHFDNNAGVFAGAKLPDEKYSMNNEDRHFYTWTLVLGLCLVIGLFVVFYNRHKVERYIVSLRRPVSNGYSRVKHGDEERNLLHHEYA